MTIENIESKVDDALSATAATNEPSSASDASEQTSDDLNAEMLAFLKSDQEGDPEPSDEDKAQTAKASDAEAKADADESDEDEDAEADAKSDDESDGAAKKKPSGWQKSKRRFEKKISELEASVADHQKQVAELEAKEREYERLSAIAIDRLKEYEQRLQEREARLTDLGAGPDPHETRVAELERQLREERQQREFEARVREEQQRKAQAQAEARRISEIKHRVSSVAEAHGIDADELAVRAAGLAKAAKYRGQPAPRLEDVAAEIVSLHRLKAGQSTQRQAEVSQQAPRPIRGAQPSPVSPSFEPTTEGMTAYLRTIGQLG